MSNRSHKRNVALLFDRDEWELLVTLPRRVLIAALADTPEGGRRAAEGIAGIEAIAAGLASPSPLVRRVVHSIYSESYSGSYSESHAERVGARGGAGGGLGGEGLGGAGSGARDATVGGGGHEPGVQTLAACRYACEVLTARCDPVDANGYRDWLRHIAAVVTGVGASSSGTASGLSAGTSRPASGSTGRVGLAESRFLYALGGVLRP